MVVKGKTLPLGIYEIMDFHTEESFPNMSSVVGRFSDGLALYRERRWEDATDAFRQALRLNPMDRASQLYVERCKQLREAPPPDDWQGEWVLTSK